MTREESHAIKSIPVCSVPVELPSTDDEAAASLPFDPAAAIAAAATVADAALAEDDVSIGSSFTTGGATGAKVNNRGKACRSTQDQPVPRNTLETTEHRGNHNTCTCTTEKTCQNNMNTNQARFCSSTSHRQEFEKESLRSTNFCVVLRSSKTTRQG